MFGHWGFNGAARFTPINGDVKTRRHKHIEAVDEIRVTLKQHLDAIDDLLRFDFSQFELFHQVNKAVAFRRHFDKCDANVL